MSIENTINQILCEVRDPITQLTPAELGLKFDLLENENTLIIQLYAGFPCKVLEATLLPLIKDALEKSLPHQSTRITLECYIKPHRTQLLGQGLRGVKNTIAIGSGKGGVGKSTVTIHLATYLAGQGARVGILDADIYGPSIPTMLGKTAPVQYQDDAYLPVQAHGIQAMSIGYLTQDDSALIWRGPMLAKALMQMLNQTLWDNLDYLFIDLPPGTGDIQLSLVQKIPLSGAIIVTTSQTVATQDAQKALMMFQKMNIDVLGIVENMSQHTCSQCGHQEAVFGHGGAQTLCDHYQTQLLGQLPLDPSITLRCDQGEPLQFEGNPNDPFLRLALKTAIELSKRPLNYSNKFPPIVVE